MIATSVYLLIVASGAVAAHFGCEVPAVLLGSLALGVAVRREAKSLAQRA